MSRSPQNTPPVSADELAAQLVRYNEAYRRGAPLISDADYDERVESLRAIDPAHPFLNTVEPERYPGKPRVKHQQPMLSIEKAYNQRALALFTARVAKAAAETNVTPVLYRVSPKLDGVAGYDDGQRLMTRGDGEYGFDITSAFAKGVVPVPGRGGALGEIVMVKSYFEAQLSSDFEHPRNLVVGIIGADQVNEMAQKALADEAVRFVSYGSLPSWQGTGDQLVSDIEAIYDDLVSAIDYPVDGVVIQVEDTALREAMGRTAHHYRWQIAYKRRGETAQTTVLDITWQVGRTGNVTPVMEVAPVRLSGATIRRVTAHNAARVETDGIGPGARIEIIRSGEVIPKLEHVVTPSPAHELPTVCPSCGTTLTRGDGDADSEKFLRCPNTSGCRDQLVQRIRHWFRVLGNADWFGVRTVEKLVDAGYDRLEKIYGMQTEDYASLGFGPVQSTNLFQAVANSQSQPVEDWRFLAAFGIPDVGVGDGRKLLSRFPLASLASVTESEISAIHGFGEKKAARIVDGLNVFRETMDHMLALPFTLIATPPAADAAEIDSPVTGKRIVFTGKMVHGTRGEMEAMAQALGATVQKAVSGTTDLLVCGENVGASKMAKAEKHGVQVMTEAAYMDLIGTAE